jgi:hypothetical protein
MFVVHRLVARRRHHETDHALAVAEFPDRAVGRLAVGADQVDHPVDHQALAGGAAGMQAIIAVGMERAVLAEHADLVPAGRYDPAVAVRHFRRLGDEPFGHERSPPGYAYPAALSVPWSLRRHPKLCRTAHPPQHACWNDANAELPPARTTSRANQLRGVSALAVGIAHAPTIVDANIPLVGPIAFLKPRTKAVTR